MEREPGFYWIVYNGIGVRALWTGSVWREYAPGSIRNSKVLSDDNISEMAQERAPGPDGTKELLLLLIDGKV